MAEFSSDTGGDTLKAAAPALSFCQLRMEASALSGARRFEKLTGSIRQSQSTVEIDSESCDEEKMPIKRLHEFRDPLHGFISVDRQERAFVDAAPFQRLRHIQQLALTPLVYPGATHKRFEHSLGVMHLARLVFDVVTTRENIHPAIEHIIPDEKHLPFWRAVISLAALAHDIGHLPFSHAAEKRLLPDGVDHESITLDLIECDDLKHIWGLGQRLHLDDVKKLAVGQKKLKNSDFSTWEAILSEIITGDSFGVDRMDYLLRDSYHSGVNYGEFDHIKLIHALRIIPKSSDEGGSREPVLGVELSGLHSAEALLLARYFMYEQVYFHPIRRIYDLHLIDYMVQHYGANGYLRDVGFHLSQTDNEVTVSLREAAKDVHALGHTSADAIINRRHFRQVYNFNPSDMDILKRSVSEGNVKILENENMSPASLIEKKLIEIFGADSIKIDLYIQGSSPALFPVLMPDGRIESSLKLSSILDNFPLMTVDSLYASIDTAAKAREWIDQERTNLLEGLR